jgi:hypothetical protein
MTALQNDTISHTTAPLTDSNLLKLSESAKTTTLSLTKTTYTITMPRQVAPPPSGEWQVTLSKPFSGRSSAHKGDHLGAYKISGTPTLQIEVIGDHNGSASIRRTNTSNNGTSDEKKGDVPA